MMQQVSKLLYYQDRITCLERSYKTVLSTVNITFSTLDSCAFSYILICFSKTSYDA